MYQGRRGGIRCGEELCRRYACFRLGPTPNLPLFLDNTNRNVQTRKYYLDIAKRLQIPARYCLQAG